MANRPNRKRALLPALLLALTLGACATGGATTRYYVLNPLPAGAEAPADTGGLSIEVASLRLPQYLERPQLVTRSADNRLELAEFHQWGGNLRKNMSRVLARNLSQLLATPHVAIAPNRPPTPPDARVELEVMQFERTADGRVRLTAQWRLVDTAGGRAVATRFTELVSDTRHPEDFEGTVAAMSRLYGELSRVIATAAREHFAAAP